MTRPRFIKLTKMTAGTHDISYPADPIYINPEHIVYLCSIKAVCVGVGRSAITKIVFRNQETLNVKESPEEIIGNIHEQKEQE